MIGTHRELIGIVACTITGGIGIENKMPWYLPEDMKHFVEQTKGHTVIMGRKTFESIRSKPLPNRRNVVITTNTEFKADGVEVVHSIRDALKLTADDEKVFIIGGAEIYRQTLHMLDRLEATVVLTKEQKEFDAFFPFEEVLFSAVISANRRNPISPTARDWYREKSSQLVETPDNKDVRCFSFQTFIQR